MSRNTARNMNLIIILCLLVHLNILSAVPVLPVSAITNEFYNELAVECHMLNDSEVLPKFINQTVFENCRNFAEIFQTENLTLTSKNEQIVRCLLYYDSFISFCKELVTVTKPEISLAVLIPDVNNYKAANFCKNWIMPSAERKFKHNVSQSIYNEIVCGKLCITYTETVYVECSLAYYYASFNVTTLAHQSVSNSQLKGKPDSELSQKSAALVTTVNEQHLKNTSLENTALKETGSVGETNKPNLGSLNEKNRGGPAPQEDPVPRGILGAPSAKKIEANEEADGTLAKPPSANKSKLSATNKTGAANQPDRKSEVLPVTQSKTSAVAAQMNPADHGKKSEVVGHATDKKNHSEVKAKQQDQDNKDSTPDVHKDDIPGSAEDTDLHSDNVNENEDPNNANVDGGDENDDDKDDKFDGVKHDEVVGKVKQQTEKKPDSVDDIPVSENSMEDLDGESYFFSYFMVICILFVLGYVGYHNRQKVMALVLEGKRGKRQYRGRRPNSANYHKLDSNLEEAISSTCTKNSTHVIY